jgi:hypothetical protein
MMSPAPLDELQPDAPHRAEGACGAEGHRPSQDGCNLRLAATPRAAQSATAPRPSAVPGAPVQGAQAKPANAGAGV